MIKTSHWILIIKKFNINFYIVDMFLWCLQLHYITLQYVECTVLHSGCTVQSVHVYILVHTVLLRVKE